MGETGCPVSYLIRPKANQGFSDNRRQPDSYGLSLAPRVMLSRPSYFRNSFSCQILAITAAWPCLRIPDTR